MMLNIASNSSIGHVRFGQQPASSNRRTFLTGSLLTALALGIGGGLLKSPATDVFQKTATAAEGVRKAEDTPAPAAQFDNLVERYYNEAPRTVKAVEVFQKKLEEVDKSALTPEYQGLHMLFDHVLKRQKFDMNEGAALTRLGVDLNTLKDQNESILPEKTPGKPSPELMSGGIGKARYDVLLQLDNFVDLDTEELIRFAKTRYDALESEMNQYARQIDPKKTWQEIYTESRKQHPTQAELLNVYRREVDKATKFLKDKDLVSIPPNRLEVIETPDWYRGRIPFAAYLGGRGASGSFMVTTVVDEDPAKVEEQLQTHHYGFIGPVTIHEAMPGHHLQHVHDQQAKVDENDPKQRTKALVFDLVDRSTFFIEGWGVYTEDLAREQGYYTTPEQHISALRTLLWRAARAWLDPQIHTGKIKYDEAVNFLVDKVLLERDRAEIEVNRYYQSPSAVASYMVGDMQIHALRDTVQDAEKDGFTLKKFHDSLLAGKELPVPVLAKMRFNQDIQLKPAAEKDRAEQKTP